MLPKRRQNPEDRNLNTESYAACVTCNIKKYSYEFKDVYRPTLFLYQNIELSRAVKEPNNHHFFHNLLFSQSQIIFSSKLNVFHVELRNTM
jgi:hypothetical protein